MIAHRHQRAIANPGVWRDVILRIAVKDRGVVRRLAIAIYNVAMRDLFLPFQRDQRLTLSNPAGREIEKEVLAIFVRDANRDRGRRHPPPLAAKGRDQRGV